MLVLQGAGAKRGGWLNGKPARHGGTGNVAAEFVWPHLPAAVSKKLEPKGLLAFWISRKTLEAQEQHGCETNSPLVNNLCQYPTG